eukprot:3012509-Prorocentrum_lima.AAC.1
MTSSLVGSEMCIRDRIEANPDQGGHVHGQGQHLPGEGQVQAQPQGPAAVSYTHLTLPTICSV